MSTQVDIHPNVKEFIKVLDIDTKPKVVKAIRLLVRFGHNLLMPHSKYLSKGIYELRVRGQREVRILYFFYNSHAYLAHAFIKKTQHLPKNDLAKALRIKRHLTVL